MSDEQHTLLLCRAAGWLAAPEGESAKSTRELIERLAAALKATALALVGAEQVPADELVEEIDSGVCVWMTTHTRGVFKSSCSMVPFREGVMPRPGSNCPYCGLEVIRDIG